ncbi:hypothetical protein GCM10025869_10810 [Homoserinibacter gongjuensis]|uniref:Uncharacterized protein n=1 Tax=Homoserinibacter gongjuensis TaxID=1162968 RepID=A0ABQ6JQH3_9MICO|nr:hypothetical protein GCM10025869_10810 [Homoserinibacter gongjuensis]
MQELRTRGAHELGITLNLTNAVPNDPSDPVDLDAARRLDALWNRAYLEPILLGAYPADFLEDVAGHGFEQIVRDGDLATIHQKIDFLGVNHYHDDNVSGHPLPAGHPKGSPHRQADLVVVRGLGVHHRPDAQPAADGHGVGDQPRRPAHAARAARPRVSAAADPLHHRERLGVG